MIAGEGRMEERMSDRMTPIPFSDLMNWIQEEKKTRDTVFGLHKPYRADRNKTLLLFGNKLETPFGPAAGPHTQLAQNLIAAYYGGGRFFELKTVQILDGEDLPVDKPCIKAEDEGYNVEWSTELYVPKAFDEYVKAWFAIRFMAAEWGLGSPDGFQFNMSVGYDLEGIRSGKIDKFIEGMKNASDTAIYKECKEYFQAHAGEFTKIKAEDMEELPDCICNSVTLSTLHGCPPLEIERIASYLLTEKGLNTFIKCNPTLLGYEFARKTLDDMGYEYVSFDDFHFKDDLQYEDAIPMLTRLMALAEEKKLAFGVKITNTFPVEIKCNELPGKEMYMSGRSLYPLSIALAGRLSEEFKGRLRISYSGGADFYNIDKIFGAGIWPVTIATTLLKPGGYERMEQMARKLAAMEYKAFNGVDTHAVQRLSAEAGEDRHHRKAVKPLPSGKIDRKVPLLNCFTAPCKEGCPIHQDITAYMELAKEGRYLEALKVITDKNPLPFITGTICAHNCMNRCTRNFYEEPVHIREMKLAAAKGGYDALMGELKAPEQKRGIKAAVVGGGPAGMAAAYFLAREGLEVTLFEKREQLGGVIRYVIPEFRIASSSIDKDAGLIRAMGVKIVLNSPVERIERLKEQGFQYIILAAGASKQSELNLGRETAVNALEFLEKFKAGEGHISIGKDVVVIGGGNTAMDAARAAKRADGVKRVRLVYRRNKRYMPADPKELLLALEDGVELMELLAPESCENGTLLCRRAVLGEMDASGRRSPVLTDEIVSIPADTVIAATGEKVDTAFYQSNGIKTDDKGRAAVDASTLETSVPGVYAAGDGLGGPATVVEAIRDAKMAAEAILGKAIAEDREAAGDTEAIRDRKGVLKESCEGEMDAGRCLVCSLVCENCTEVCPNRANVSIHIEGMEMAQIVHVDQMCNECGNCRSFCPYDSAPYQDKFTLFANDKDFRDSENEGFYVVDQDTLQFKVRYGGREFETAAGDSLREIPAGLLKVMETTCREYSYLLF